MKIDYVKFLILIYSVTLSCSSSVEKSVKGETIQQLWHSYEFGTGVGNREEPDFAIVELKEYFTLHNEVYKWKSLKLQGEIIIIGLAKNFLLISNYGNNSKTFEKREDIWENTTDFITFQKWDARSQSLKTFIVVSATTATNNCTNYLLKWYIIENENLIFFNNWPFYKQITFLDSIKINNELKLFIVSQQKDVENNESPSSGDIYSFSTSPQLDIWLYEKILFNFTPSSVSIFNENENTFVIVSFSSTNIIQIWKYSQISCLQNGKHFNLHQTISAVNLNSLNTFRVAFRWYLITAGKLSSIYQLKENLLFYPVTNLTIENVDNWFVVPIDNYREDKVFISISEKRLTAATWNENGNVRIVQNLTQNLCKNDSDCEEKVNKVNIMKSTTFPFNGHQIVLMPSESGITFTVTLIFKLKSLPDVKVLKLNELLEAKKFLEKNYSDLNTRIKQLTSNEKYFKSQIEKNTTSNVQITQGQSEKIKNFETLSSIKNWTDVHVTLEKLKATMSSLMNDIEGFRSKEDISSNGFKRSEEFVRQKNLTEGITFYGNVIINNLNVNILNGHKVDDLLKNLYRKDRKDKITKIGGIKTLKNVKAKHVSFNKVKNISNCDIIFADDYLEGKGINVNGDVIFENSINIFNDVKIEHLHDAEDNFDKSMTMIPNVKMNTFDMLHFEDLEITSETDILTSINFQPLILPVHNVPIDLHYLNVANQARIEHVNVLHNLTVGSINGQNFNNITNQILLKKKAQKEKYKTTKIKGVLSVDSLVVNKIMSRQENLKESISEPEVNLSQIDLSYDIDKKFSQNSQSSKSRRKIFVFQNLEVNGVIHTNKINNLDWSLLNDTVRKDLKTVIKGKKLFKKTVTTDAINIYGTINDIKPENFLNDFAEQTFQFPQNFNKVEFRNLTLKGTWDGIDLKNFNFSEVKPWEFKGDLSLKNCSLITDTLEVLDSINNISLRNCNESNRHIDVSVESIDSLKFINASKVFINGSLFSNEGINNINISSLNEKRVSVTKPQIIQQNISLENFTFHGEINIVNLNGKNLSSLIKPENDIEVIEKFLKKETTKLKKLLVKGEIKTTNGINGYDLSNLAENGIQITENNTIIDSLIFENTVFFEKLNVSGTINYIDLKQLEKDLVFQSDNVFLRGVKNFTRLKVTKDAKIRFLNGHFIEDIVTLKGNHIIKGTVQVNGNVIVRGNVTSNGAINDIMVPVLLKKYSTQHNSFVVAEDLNLTKNNVSINKLLVGGTLQNTNFEDLMKKAVLKDESFNVKGNKLFKGEVKFKKNILVEETINGVDVKKLFQDIVMINEPAKIEGTVRVEEAALSTIGVKEYFNSSLINNIDMNDWLEESIPLDEENVNVYGKMTFEKPVAFKNIEVDFINGQISSAVILLNEKQQVPISIGFENVNVTSEINVGRFVNGKNLLQEFQDSIMVNGPQVIEGNLLFLEDFTINGNLSTDTIKGKKVNDLITLDTPQTISNKLIFQGSVVATKGLAHVDKINNIDIVDWYNKSVQLNRNQEINGYWKIKGNIKAKNIKGEAFVGSVSLLNVSKVIQENRRKAIERKNETEVEYYNQCRRIEQFSEKFTKQPYVFNQFEISQVIETSLAIESVISFKISNSEHLIITYFNNCLSTLYKWDRNNSNFIKVRQINIGPVSKWLVSYQNRTTYLITSSINSDVDCEEDLLPGNIWTFEENADKYVHLYTTDSFVDAIQDNNTSPIFYTLEKGGAIFQWLIKSGTNISFKLLATLGQENYKFIDKRIFNDLAVSNGKEIKVVRSVDGKIVIDNIFLNNNNIVALPINQKTFAAIVVKDKIIVYENISEEKIFSVIHTFRANSLLWFNYGFEKQAFLIVSSHHKLIEIYEYKSVSGFVKRTSLPLFSTKLQYASLPLKNKFQPSKFVIAVQKKKIVFIEAEMMGDFFETTDSLCL